MNKELIAGLLVLMGSVCAGMVHNGNTLIIGLGMIFSGLTLMWLAGFSKGKRRA